MASEIKAILQTDNGIVAFDGMTVKAGFGRHGVVTASAKKEGDGKTPLGRWPLRQIYYRADRLTLPPLAPPPLALDCIAITEDMGWCDDPDHPQYNQVVSLPFDASHEVLWRDDHAYDVVIPLGYNDDPPIAGEGSAIFFHLLHEGRDVTEGCVAIALDAMMAILPRLTKETTMIITRD